MIFLVTPFWNAETAFERSIHSGFAMLSSKAALEEQNRTLKEEIAELERDMQGYNMVVQENIELRKKLGTKKDGGIFGNVISRPNTTPYDTFVLDIGARDGVYVKETVIADDNIALGTVETTYGNNSKVKLFSSPERTTNVILEPSNTEIQVTGNGGGSFYAELPEGIDVKKGDAIILPGEPGYVIGYVADTSATVSDSFRKVYFSGPVNIFTLKLFQVIKNKGAAVELSDSKEQK